MKALTEKMILNILEEVKDPEIPVLSLNDLGIIHKIKIIKEKVFISLIPTFVGCPALEYIKNDVEDVLKRNGVAHYEVKFTFNETWNSNRITEKGREALVSYGFGAPPQHDLLFDIDILDHIQCPYCESENTVMKSPFGPTLCRSLHYCDNCKQAFEQFKPI